MNFTKVSVLGAGTMGCGIGQVIASSGISVCISDIDPTALSNGISKIRTNLNKMVERGKIKEKGRRIWGCKYLWWFSTS
jgi:3-hydroxyacyl-CoA dehydrogenase